MMESYRLSPSAEADLYRIWLYGLEQWGVAKADLYHIAIFERFEEIATNPLLYPTASHIRDGYRKSVCGVDTIYYRVIDDTVEIMNILGRQDHSQTIREN